MKIGVECIQSATTINTLKGAIPTYNQNRIKMDKNKLHDEIVVDESRKLYNILNFQDFMLEESKKDKKEPKKCKKLIKNREEYIDDMDIIDPNECPERYVKLREQFIKEDYK